MEGSFERRRVSEDEAMAGLGWRRHTEKSGGCLDGRKWEGDEGVALCLSLIWSAGREFKLRKLYID